MRTPGMPYNAFLRSVTEEGLLVEEARAGRSMTGARPEPLHEFRNSQPPEAGFHALLTDDDAWIFFHHEG